MEQHGVETASPLVSWGKEALLLSNYGILSSVENSYVIHCSSPVDEILTGHVGAELGMNVDSLIAKLRWSSKTTAG